MTDDKPGIPDVTRRYITDSGTLVPAGFELAIVEGAGVGRSLTVDATAPGRQFIGSSEACDLRIPDPLVSRRHAAVEVRDWNLVVTDLDSTNGTFVNGVDIAEARLIGGEVVRVGETALVVHADRRGPPELSQATRFGTVIGHSVELRRLYPLFERIAQSEIPVLIEGETGTGKELLAESIHDASSRATGPFVVLDCTTIAPQLLESELFGHERGAFTGAHAAHAGVFEQAHRGSLLIDEIGDLDISLQAKLLRAIEKREVRRLGGSRWLSCDVRVIAATRRNLEQEIAEGRFRDDLFYRLAVARVELPPLRKRRGDIGALVRAFWKQLSGNGEPPPDLLQRFERHSWPGNVRELHNAVSAHLALGRHAGLDVLLSRASVDPSTAPDVLSSVLQLDLPLGEARQRVVEEFERRYLRRALERSGGSVVEAARASGVARRYFQVLKARRIGS